MKLHSDRERRELIAGLARLIARLSDPERVADKDWYSESIEWLAWSIEALANGDEKECRKCLRIALREMERKGWGAL